VGKPGKHSSQYVTDNDADADNEDDGADQNDGEAGEGQRLLNRSRREGSVRGRSNRGTQGSQGSAFDDSSDDEDEGAQRLGARGPVNVASVPYEDDGNAVRNSIVIGSVVVVDDTLTSKDLNDVVGTELPLGTVVSEIPPPQNADTNQNDDDDGEWIVATSRRRGKSQSGASAADAKGKTQSSSKGSGPKSGAANSTNEGKSASASKDSAAGTAANSTTSSAKAGAPLEPAVVPLTLTVQVSGPPPESNDRPVKDSQQSDADSKKEDTAVNADKATQSTNATSPNTGSLSAASPGGAKTRERTNSLAQKSLNWDDDTDSDSGYAILTPQMRSPPMGSTPSAAGSRTPVTGGGGAVRLAPSSRFSLNGQSSHQRVSSNHFAASPTNGSANGRPRGNSNAGRSREPSVSGSPRASTSSQVRTLSGAAGGQPSASPSSRTGTVGTRSRTGSVSNGTNATSATGFSILQSQSTAGSSPQSSAVPANPSSAGVSWRAKLTGGSTPTPSNPSSPLVTPRSGNPSSIPVMPLKHQPSNSKGSPPAPNSPSGSPSLSSSYAARLQQTVKQQ